MDDLLPSLRMEVCLHRLYRMLALSLVLVAAFFVTTSNSHAARIKDIVAFEGVRDNILVGYGLVVGLNGTGDRLQNNAFTEQSLIGFLERQGVNTRGVTLGSKNVAAVTLTAKLPPFARAGSNIDVSVSALGDAKSLLGGTLLATSLSGPDGNVYGVAQGPVTVGGFTAGGNSGSNITKGVPTSGFIPNGAIVEREIDFRLNDLQRVRLSLRNPDVTTASNLMRAINQQLGAGTSNVDDPGTVTVNVPVNYKGDVVGMLADIETLPVATDQPARIVVDEATGTIVMGENVRISTVAVAQGNLIVKVEETPQVSQPNPFSPGGAGTGTGAETTVVPRSDVTISEQSGNKIAVLQEGATLKDMVAGLNALGVGPRDLITILQTIKAAGALQADIETR